MKKYRSAMAVWLVVAVQLAGGEKAGKPAPGAEEKAADAAALKFPDVKKPDFHALIAARLDEQTVREPTPQVRQALHRAVRNFADSSDVARNKIIREIQSHGRVAYPFLAAAYTHPAELPERVELLRALAAPGQAFSAPIFADAHETAVAAMSESATQPPKLPPDYLSKKERQRPDTRAETIKRAAENVLELEGYASTAGGPFNVLFLWEIYSERYGGEKVDPLLNDVQRDGRRLAAAAADFSKTRSTWTAADKSVLTELAFADYFHGQDDQQALAKEFLKKVLPAGHPKWDADESEWVEWWRQAREKMHK